MAGATAVEIGTANFLNPRAPMDILEGLEKFLRKEKIKDIRKLIGIARLKS
jgi:dihydroorotate dehydrogenase (NAD+) catalytic subunit